MAWLTFGRTKGIVFGGLFCLAVLAGAHAAQGNDVQSLEDRVFKLRSLPDRERAVETKDLALQIRKLPPGQPKVNAASGLSNLATEGDFGRDTLQEVTTTLAEAVDETPQPEENGQPAYAYLELAQLARYEGMKVSLNSPEYRTALAKVEAITKRRATADFTLTDLQGKKWKRSALKGKVVLVNFWATWCPPCRKEMPDMNSLYKRFKAQGFVILAISDEKRDVVQKFIKTNGYVYPILLDPGRKVNDAYEVDGIPKSFVYDRSGKLVALAMDMRTKNQLLAMLAKAGLK